MKKEASEAINYLREKEGVSQKKLAELIGLKAQQGLFNILNAKKGMRVDNFVKLANVFGYQVIIRRPLTGEEIEIINPQEVESE